MKDCKRWVRMPAVLMEGDEKPARLDLVGVKVGCSPTPQPRLHAPANPAQASKVRQGRRPAPGPSQVSARARDGLAPADRRGPPLPEHSRLACTPWAETPFCSSLQVDSKGQSGASIAGLSRYIRRIVLNRRSGRLRDHPELISASWSIQVVSSRRISLGGHQANPGGQSDAEISVH